MSKRVCAVEKWRFSSRVLPGFSERWNKSNKINRDDDNNRGGWVLSQNPGNNSQKRDD